MSENNPPPIYGMQKPGLPKTFLERLHELWEPHEYVRIMNIDSDTFYWQSIAPQDENFDIDRGPTKITYRRPPRQYSIKAGESIPLEGWNAYIAVEQLYKKVLSRHLGVKGEQQTGKDGRPSEKIINWQDPSGWDVYLPRIFLGKEVPTFGGQEVANPVDKPERKAETDAPSTTDNVPKNAYTVSELAKELGIEVSA
jgi:hypothetical protein